MGFGILFIGYFLLLNLTYYGYTDLISALVIFMAFYKLQPVNKYFRFGLIPAGLFGAVALVELVEALMSSFSVDLSFLIDYTAASRYFLIGFISVYMLMGIESIAREVDATTTRTRARVALPLSYILFAAATVFEFPYVGDLIPPKALTYVATSLLFLMFILMIMNLITIYSAYMHICMPEDVDNDVQDKPSKFGFVNKFRDHEVEKNREYAEYKLNKARQKAAKKKKRKK